MKKIVTITLITFFVFLISDNIQAQPCWPCPPGTYCPACAGGGNCVDDSECVPEVDPGGPIGDEIPLDGGATALLIIGSVIAANRKLKLF